LQEGGGRLKNQVLALKRVAALFLSNERIRPLEKRKVLRALQRVNFTLTRRRHSSCLKKKKPEHRKTPGGWVWALQFSQLPAARS